MKDLSRGTGATIIVKNRDNSVFIAKNRYNAVIILLYLKTGIRQLL